MSYMIHFINILFDDEIIKQARLDDVHWQPFNEVVMYEHDVMRYGDWPDTEIFFFLRRLGIYARSLLHENI